MCVGIEEQYGGFGLPALVNNILLQMISRTDAGLMTIVGLQAGAADDIQMYASEELKNAYLPRFVSGEIMGAMDLTEPQAGSDLGAIATRASEENGRCFLEGEKIYITNGGCEVHLVLARDHDTYEESKGSTRGLSLYLCPRTLPDGTRNHLEVMEGVKSTADNLKAAIDGENMEHVSMYPEFIEQAMKEQNQNAERTFEWARKVERMHESLYKAALDAIQGGGTLETKDIYVCQVCGTTLEFEAPEKCPVCGAPKTQFIKID